MDLGAELCRDLDALLREVDIVDVCSPTGSHPEVVAEAARAGRHVICEKPLARSAPEAAEMVAVCASAGVQLHPAQVVRFFPRYAAARAAVAQGEIGTVRALQLTRRGPAPESDWFRDEAQSGGVLLDLCVHDVDFARWVAGEVVAVVAETRLGTGGTARAEMTLEHAEGARSRVTGEWLPGDQACGSSFVLSGSRGELREGRAHEPVEASEDPFVTQLRELASAVTGGPAPRVTAADAVAAVEICTAALESARTGARVAL